MTRTEYGLLLAVVTVALGAAASDRLEARRIGALAQEVKTLRSDLRTLQQGPKTTIQPTRPRPEPKPTSPTGATTSPASTSAGDARDAVTRLQVSETKEWLGAVDEDLADLEDHVGKHMARIEQLDDGIDRITAAVNNHADAIDSLAAEIDEIQREINPLRGLGDVMSVQDGDVVIERANLILRQGRSPSGVWDGTGRLLTQVPPPAQ